MLLLIEVFFGGVLKSSSCFVFVRNLSQRAVNYGKGRKSIIIFLFVRLFIFFNFELVNLKKIYFQFIRIFKPNNIFLSYISFLIFPNNFSFCDTASTYFT